MCLVSSKAPVITHTVRSCAASDMSENHQQAPDVEGEDVEVIVLDEYAYLDLEDHMERVSLQDHDYSLQASKVASSTIF